MERNRRRGLIATVAATGALLLTGGTAFAADLTPEELQKTTDSYLYEHSLDEFTETRSEQPHADQLDWSSDGCSYSPDSPFGYKFLQSCHRHDFGYRNYKKQERFSEDNRLEVDDNFRDDMYSVCDGDRACEATADLYYQAVRQFGGSASSLAEAVEMADVPERAAQR
ncbi:phospholipase [Saccharopolyspora mangrovi]|uniref:Phospholipase n=1 Tax=Saccharopolyspora mangrovi TaxID=3082379 RepID=A0ABU6A659_9PSEU|nr:phospholipase [Saccharopolyspora sp. S2-29]MEB3366981.1 phospholipase [Saccharopolyspora sp. S2-29]